jgi:hypothetical protein
MAGRVSSAREREQEKKGGGDRIRRGYTRRGAVDLTRRAFIARTGLTALATSLQ